MRLPVIFSLSFCLALIGCKKSIVVTDEPADNRTYLVRSYYSGNDTPALTVNLFLNREDYYNDRNIVKTYIIPANIDSIEVDLDSNTTYYYDVYSDDYTMTNWASWPYLSYSFKTNIRSGRYRVNNSLEIHRPLLLPDNKPSKWVAVGSFVKAGSTWDTMSAEGRNKSIVFQRNQIAIFTDGSTTREFRFGVTANRIAKNAYYIKFYDTDALELIDPQYEKTYLRAAGPVSTEYNELNQYSQNSNLVLPVTDTFYLTGDAVRHTFIMVREN